MNLLRYSISLLLGILILSTGLSSLCAQNISFRYVDSSAPFGIDFPDKKIRHITAGDINNDGDFDLFVTVRNLSTPLRDSLYYLENIGTPSLPLFGEPELNPFNMSAKALSPFPALVDLDRDGDLDFFLVYGKAAGTDYFENIGNSGQPNFLRLEDDEPFGMHPEGFDFERNLEFGDLDFDGDADLINRGRYFKNIGSNENPFFEFTTLLSPFSSGFNKEQSEFVDLDGDGDLDIVTSTQGSGIELLENIGTPEIPSFQDISINSFIRLPSEEVILHIEFLDLDGDGDLDCLAISEGKVYYFAGTVGQPQFSLSEDDAPFNITDVGANSKPSFADIDGDGDQDALIGNSEGNLVFFNNIGTPFAPSFSPPSTNPFALVDVGAGAAPAFADFDSDGDIDLVIGTQIGHIYDFENQGSATSPNFPTSHINDLDSDLLSPGILKRGSSETTRNYIIAGNNDGLYHLGARAISASVFQYIYGFPEEVFGLTDIGNAASPTFIDIDGDGFEEALVGELGGQLNYFEYTHENFPKFFGPGPGVVNPFGLSTVGFLSSPVFSDIDTDGDYDLFVGESSGKIKYFENKPCLLLPEVNHMQVGQKLYQASSQLTSRAKIHFGNIEMRAVDAIEIEKGFEVTSGATLSTKIGACLN